MTTKRNSHSFVGCAKRKSALQKAANWGGSTRLSIVSVIALATSVQAGTIYVKSSATGLGTGESWADATTLQDALNDAGTGDQIWVMSGTYKPGTNSGDSFHLKLNVP